MRRTRSNGTVIPLSKETLRVGKRRVATGRIRVKTKVRQRWQSIDEPTFGERVSIERIKVNKPVDAPPPVRHEGDAIIIPLVAEQLVVRKQLVLVEELRIVRRREQLRNGKPKQYLLRHEEAQIERVGGNGSHSREKTPRKNSRNTQRRSHTS
jgi:uncharacterized protein (TIGR02271 family)